MRILSLVLIFTLTVQPASAGFVELKKLDKNGKLYQAIASVDELRVALKLEAPKGGSKGSGELLAFNGKVADEETISSASKSEFIAFNGKVADEEVQAAYSSASKPELIAFNGSISNENITGVGKTEVVELLTFNGNVSEESLLQDYTNRDIASFKGYDQVVCNVAQIPDGMVFHLKEKKKVYIQTGPSKIEILFNSVTKKNGKINFEYGADLKKAVATLDKGYFAFALPDTKTGEIKKILKRSDLKEFPKACYISSYESVIGRDNVDLEKFLLAIHDKAKMKAFIKAEFSHNKTGSEDLKVCEKAYKTASRNKTPVQMSTKKQRIDVALEMQKSNCIFLIGQDFSNIKASGAAAETVALTLDSLRGYQQIVCNSAKIKESLGYNKKLGKFSDKDLLIGFEKNNKKFEIKEVQKQVTMTNMNRPQVGSKDAQNSFLYKFSSSDKAVGIKSDYIAFVLSDGKGSYKKTVSKSDIPKDCIVGDIAQMHKAGPNAVAESQSPGKYTDLDTRCEISNGKFSIAARRGRRPASVDKICFGIVKCTGIKDTSPQVIYCPAKSNGTCGTINECANAPSIEGVTNIEKDFDVFKALKGQ